MSELTTSTRLLGLLVLLASATSGPLCHANHEWRVLDRHSDALAARIELIHMARTDIRMACFTIDCGIVVETLVEQLEARASDGVCVKLLVDGLPSRQTIERLRGCLKRGIEIRVFHPLKLLRMDTLNRRLHSKLMVVDGQAGILGSRNLTDRHFGLGDSNFVDCDVLIGGPICKSMQDYFDRIWYSPSAVPLEQIRPSLVCLKSSSPERPRGELPFGQLDDDTVELDWLRSAEATVDCQQAGESLESMPHGLAAGKCLSLWYDRNIKKTDRTMASQVERLVDLARQEVCIESPYPAFSRAFSACLRRAARRGIRVTILTNSISSTDQILTQAAYQNQKAIWLGIGVQLFEYNGPDHLHSKKMIVDNCIAWIGSYNFDARSERLNLELALQVADPEFVNALSESMRQRQSSSTRACNAGCENIRSASLRDRAKMRLFQAFMPVLRPLL